MMSADSALKEVYRSAIIMGPENEAAAIGDGTVLEQMRDTARNMRARITAYLGRPHSTTGRRSTVHPHAECSLPSGYDWKASSTRPSPSIVANNNSQTHYTQVSTAAEGQSLHITGEGDLGPLTAVLLSDNIRHNCISISQLCDHNYTITFDSTNVKITNYTDTWTGSPHFQLSFRPHSFQVASDAKDPADYSFLVGTQHLDDEDGILYETTRVVVQKGFIVAYRRSVTTAGVKPREETTPIHIADVARMTATLQCPSPDDRVQRALETPRNDTPGPRRQVDISLNPDRRFEAPLEVPSSSSALPIWNTQGRLATSTPADKRRRLSQGLELRTNLASEFQTPPQRGHHKIRSHYINVLFLLCLHMSCPQSYTQALKSPDHQAWKQSMDEELDTLQNKRQCWEVVPYPKQGRPNYSMGSFVELTSLKY
jgi:hypothetical protein